MALEGPSKQEATPSYPAQPHEVKPGNLNDRQVVLYSPKIPVSFHPKKIELIVQDFIGMAFREALELDRAAVQHLYMRGNIFILTGTSTAGKTSITRQLAKEVPDVVELGLDDYFEKYGPEMDADLIRTKEPKLYEALMLALEKPADIAFAIYTNDEVHWKSGISREVLNNAQQALIEAREKRDFFPHVSLADIKARMMEEGMKRSSTGRAVIFDLWKPNDSDLFVERMIEKDFYAPLKRGLVYCPFHELAERVKKRNQEAIASGNKDNCRNPLIPLDQFCEFYRPAEKGEASLDILHRNGPNGVEEAFESAFSQRLIMLEPDPTDSLEDIAEKTKEISALKKDHAGWKKHIMTALGFRKGVTEVPITLRNKRVDTVFNTYVLNDPKAISSRIRTLI